MQNFLSGKDLLGLDKKVVTKNLKNLKVKSCERVVAEMEYLDIVLEGSFSLNIFEDGLITLKVNIEKNDKKNDLLDLVKEIEKIKNFYETKLATAFSYLFSRGAPVPKELAKIENIYPFILNVEAGAMADILEVFEKLEDEISSKIVVEKVGIYKGKKIMILENLPNDKVFNLFAETEIFFREFKAQMARYLHIHREIWEKINIIKSKDYLRGDEIFKTREELQQEQKTINLIEARINQMPVYLKTRQKLTNLGDDYKNLHPLFQYKFETLLDTHDYVKSLWSMTKNYLNSANEMLGVLQTESTKSSISSLTLITTIGVVAGIVNYMTRDTLPKFTSAGFWYFIILLLVTFSINMAVMYFYKFKKYKIK